MSQINNRHNILIAGDLFPSKKNIPLFKDGNALEIFGEKILGLFRDASFSLINLEGALTSSDIPQIKTGPIIKAPETCIEGIKGLGVTAVSLANNHITDYGRDGFLDTVRTLDCNGIEHIGAGESQNDINNYLSIVIGNRRVCIYTVSELFYNQATTTSPGVNLYDEYVVCNELKSLKQKHDYLIVIYHGGTEGFPYPTPLLQKRFHRMADCGADFITAQHSHCIGCYETYNGSYLLYGQGNFLFARMKKDITKHGLISEICFDDNGIKIHNHLVNVSQDEVVRYDDLQDFSSFHARSEDILDFENIQQKFRQYCFNDSVVKNTILKSFRGCPDSRLYNLYLRLSQKLFGKRPLEQYRRDQLMRMSRCMESERYAENMQACIQFMMENEMWQGH